MSNRLLIERIIDFEKDAETIQQKVATLSVENPDEWSPERLLEKAYNEANMSEKRGEHRITALGKSIEVENEQ